MGFNGIDEAVNNTFSTSTTQTLHSLTMPVNCAGGMNVRITARRLSDGAMKIFFMDFAIKRLTGNTEIVGLNILNAKGTVADLLALALVSATIDNSGEDLRVRVTGLASTDIEWGVRLTGEVWD